MSGPTIRVSIDFEGNEQPLSCYAFLDSGATGCFIPELLVKSMLIPCTPLPRPVNVQLANNSTQQVTKLAKLKVVIMGEEYEEVFAVFPCAEVVLGYNFQQKYFETINFKRKNIQLITKSRRETKNVLILKQHTVFETKSKESAGMQPKSVVADAELLLLQSEQEAKKSDIEFLVQVHTVLPPMHECAVQVVSTIPSNSVRFVTNNTAAGLGLVVKNQLLPADSQVVLVTNFNRHPVLLRPGQPVATGHKVNDIHHFMVTSKGMKVLNLVPAELEVISSGTDEEEFNRHHFNQLVFKDTFRTLSKNKSPENYPSFYSLMSSEVRRMMKAEMADRVPDYVLEQNLMHPNKNPDVPFENFDFSCFNVGRDGASKPEQLGIRQKIYKYRNAFIYSKKDLGTVDRSKLPKINVTLKDDDPICTTPYRRSPKDRKIIEELIEEMLEAGIIRPSESPYASPVVVVSKKDGTKRMCVDYRLINAKTIRDSYPLPLVADALDACAGSSWFSSVDLFSGYHLLPMDEESIPKTAFISHCGLFEYLVLPFGLTSAPAKFQKLMDRILGSLKWTSCFVYLDDIVIFAKTFEEHQLRLEKVLAALDSVNLKLNPKKCMFGFRQLEFLGHIVSEKGIRPSEHKVEKIKAMKPPKNVTQLRQFLGLVGYFRSFVKDFSKIASPLHKLLKGGADFHFGPEQMQAFEALKNALITSPVRTFFREDAEHEVHTDASILGLGAVLVQKEVNEDGKEEWKPVQYWARGLKPAEQNYAVVELELCAVVEALEAFRAYLHGLSFTVVTDHQALLALDGKGSKDGKGDLGKRANRRIMKWKLLLRDFDFKIRYKKGKYHYVPDALSRMEQEPTEGIEPDEERMFFGATQSVVDTAAPVPDFLPLSSLSAAQQNDPYCQEIINSLQDGTANKSNRLKKLFMVVNDLLYRRWITESESHICAVIPACYVKLIINHFHDGPMGVHPGQNRTVQIIRDKYWWPRLKHDVIDYVRKCRHCLKKKPVRYAKPETKPTCDSFLLRSTLRPFQWLCIDLIDLKDYATFHRNRYIVVVSDYLTKYLITGSLKTASAKELTDWFFAKVKLFVSEPEVLISDNGTNFRSKEFKKFCDECKIDRRYIAPYRASSNGQVERMNGVIKEALSSFVSPNQRDWDKYLQVVTYGINCLTSTVTGKSPFEAVFGFKPRNTLDNKLANPDLVTSDFDPDTRNKMWKEMWERVKSQGERLKKRKVKNYLPTFEVGEKVVILDHTSKVGKVKGFVPLFKENYVVVKRLATGDTYKVANGDNPDDVHTVHVSEMKKDHEGDPTGILVDKDFEPDLLDPDEVVIPLWLQEKREEEREEPLARKRRKKKNPPVQTGHPMVLRDRGNNRNQ